MNSLSLRAFNYLNVLASNLVVESFLTNWYEPLYYHFNTNHARLFFFKILYYILFGSYDIIIWQCSRSNWEIKALCKKID